LSNSACSGIRCLHSEGFPWLARLSQSSDPALQQIWTKLITGDIADWVELQREIGANWLFVIDPVTGSLIDIVASGPVDLSLALARMPSLTEQYLAQVAVTAVGSMDPNDIIGPAGVGIENWITGEGMLLYTIRFENLDSATAPAHEIAVGQLLDPSLDPQTLEFVAFGLGDEAYPIPAGRSTWTQRLDLRSTRGVYADVTLECDPASGLVSCYWAAVDPQTLALPDDPFAGILPPNTAPPLGEGWIAYRVRARSGLPTGTRIDAQARIVFDLNDPIDTPVVFNTIDNTPPETAIGSVAPSSATTVRVPWASVAQPGEGSLLERVTLYASLNDGPFEPVATGGPEDSELQFAGSAFNRYRLLLVGVDAAGNVEVGEPSGLLPETQCFDAVADDQLNSQDYFQFLNWYLAGDMRADVNGDGVLDMLDATAVALGLF